MKFSYDKLDEAIKLLNQDEYAEKAEILFLEENIVVVPPKKKKKQ